MHRSYTRKPTVQWDRDRHRNRKHLAATPNKRVAIRQSIKED